MKLELTTKNFQYILFAVFILFIVIGVIVFSVSGNRARNTNGGAVSGVITVWGSLPKDAVETLTSTLNKSQVNNFEVRYVEKDPATYDDELLNALASGEGPDLFFLPHTKLAEHENKIFVIPYESYPRSTYSTQFIDEADIFLLPTGVAAFPVVVDPMVMYFNRTMLNARFIVEPPVFWDEFLTFSPILSEQTESGQLLQSAVAMGTFDNITHAKDILSLITLQSGNPLVIRTATGQPTSTINSDDALASAVRFYTGFANPAQDHYSWNIGFTNDREAFLANETAVYFGYASELSEMRRINNNLDFDVALMPQIRDSQAKVTHGMLTGLAISKTTPSLQAAFTAANQLSNVNYADALSSNLLLPPVHRASLLNQPDDPFMAMFYNSALIARGWLDPNPEATDQVFRTLVRNTNSGAVQVDSAVSQASVSITNLFRR